VSDDTIEVTDFGRARVLLLMVKAGGRLAAGLLSKADRVGARDLVERKQVAPYREDERPMFRLTEAGWLAAGAAARELDRRWPDLTALVDKRGDTWVRIDEHTSLRGNWWPLTDGPGWEQRARDGLGQPRSLTAMLEHAPFTMADRARTAHALARVRREVAAS
jgi:hypothetical protein